MLDLSKGQSLDLNKETGKTLKTVRLGAGWDVAAGKSVDLDFWLLPRGAKPLYFKNMTIPGATLDGDDRTGGTSKDGADENIAIDVAQLASEEIELAVAWLKGEVSLTQVNKVLQDYNAINNLARMLQQAYTEGKIAVK